jgi:hypothetical protein
MDKISGAQAEQLLKTAAANVRALSTELTTVSKENGELKNKIAHFERKEHAERLAILMEEKSVKTELSFPEKVASLLDGDRDLKVVEEALTMGVPQIKVASVDDDSITGHEPGTEDLNGEAATESFLAGLME